MPKLPDERSFGARPSSRTAFANYNVVSPESDAPARATQNLGKTLQNVGQNIYDIQNKKIEEHNTLMAENAYNDLTKRRIELTSGETGFKSKKGKDAIDENNPLITNYGSQFDEQIAEIEGGMYNDDMRQKFRRRAEIAKLNLQQDMANHVSAEREQFAKQTMLDTNEIESRNMQTQYADPLNVEMSANRIDNTIKLYGKNAGWDKKTTDNALFNAKSDAYTGMVIQAVSDKRDTIANDFFKTYEKQIDPKQYPRLKKMLDTASTEGFVQRVYDESILSKKDRFKVYEEVRAKYKNEPAKRKDAIEGLQAKYAQRELTANNTAWDIFSRTGDPKKIPPDVYDAMSPKERIQMERASKGPAEHSNVETIYMLDELMISDPDKFRDREQTNLLKFRNDLSVADFKKYSKMQVDLTDESYGASKAAIRQEFVAAMGVDPKNLTKTGSNGDKARAMGLLFDEKLKSFEASMHTRPNLKEMREFLKNTTVEVIQKGLFYGTNTYPAGQVEDISGVDRRDIPEYAAAVQQSGSMVTDDNIRRAAILNKSRLPITKANIELVEKTASLGIDDAESLRLATFIRDAGHPVTKESIEELRVYLKTKQRGIAPVKQKYKAPPQDEVPSSD